MDKLKIGVVGGGLMGHGIGYLLAAAGHEARIFEPSADICGDPAARCIHSRAFG
jgi:3-hydroxyacyl-CoA dehydrogenase